MSRKKTKTKRRYSLLLIVGVYLLAKVIGSYYLKVGLQKTFSKGSGSIVTIDSANVTLFPPSGVVNDVTIRYPTEPVGKGFHAEKLTVGISLHRLLFKQVYLKNLIISGTTIDSQGMDTGFMQTMIFLFEDSPKKPKPKTWHDFLTKGWKTRVSEIRIESKKDKNNSVKTLDLGLLGRNFIWEDLSFEASCKDPFVDKYPFAMKAKSNNFILQTPNGNKIPFSSFFADTTNHHGLLKIIEARASFENNQKTNSIHADGEIYLKDQGEYRLDIKGDASAEYLQEIFKNIPEIPVGLFSRAKATGKLSGTLEDPKVDGKLKLKLSNQQPFFKNQKCRFKNLQTDFKLDTEHVQVSKLKIDSVIKNGMFEVDFSEIHNFSSGLELEFNQKDQFVETCLRPIKKDGSKNSDADLDEAFGAIGIDSLTIANIKGTFVPLMIDGQVKTQVNRSDPLTRATLNVKLDYEKDRLSINLDEQSDLDQVQESFSSSEIFEDLNALQTPVPLAKNSIIKGLVKVDFENQKLTTNNLEISRYPLNRFIARVTPFIEKELADKFFNFTQINSQLNAKLNLSFDFDPSVLEDKIQGSVELNAEDLLINREESFSVRSKAEFSEKQINISKLNLFTKAGKISGSLKIDEQKEITGQFSSNHLQYDQLDLLKKYLAGLMTVNGELKLDITGKLDSPVYKGILTAETKLDNSETKQNSKINFSGNTHELEIIGGLIGDSAKINLFIPLNKQTLEIFKADVTLEKFPLGLFLPLYGADKTESDVAVLSNSIDAKVKYEGEMKDLLAGEGELVATKIKFGRTQDKFTNPKPIIISIADGRLTFKDFQLKREDQQVVVEGYLDRAEGWATVLKANANLDTLVGHFKNLEQLTGVTKLVLNVSGEPSKPGFLGNLSVSDGAVSVVAGDGIFGADSIEFESKFEGSRLEITKFSGQMGDGEFSGDGEVTGLFEYDYGLNISLLFNPVEVQPSDELFFDFQGRMNLFKEQGKTMVLSGEMFIEDALYEEVVNFKNLISEIKSKLGNNSEQEDQSLNFQGESLENDKKSDLEFDLKITANDGFLVKTNIVNAELGAKLAITGNAGKPILVGKIYSVSGEFGLGSQKFDILKADIIFPESVVQQDPILDILGETAVTDGNGDDRLVRMQIKGTLKAPEINFSSDGGLSETEIVSMLSLGTGLEDISLLSFQGSTKRTLVDLINPVSGVSIVDRIRGITDFSEVSLDSTFSLETREVIPKVTAKRPIVNQLDLKLETELSGNQNSEMGVEYKLTPTLKLFGGWKSYSVTNSQTNSGSFEGGVKFNRNFGGVDLLPPGTIAEDE